MKYIIRLVTRLHCILMCLICIIATPVHSEVTLDGSTGTSRALTGPDYQITENLGQREGRNLFHSFGRFNLNRTESATFSGSPGIQNVISRVTGGQTSTIDGLLKSTIPNANLYFLNPAGVIFGENARIDVLGSFHTSTADYLGFKDGVRFDSADLSAFPILTAAAPEAFGFLGSHPAGKINVSGGENSILELKQGKTLSLIGGDINIKNNALYAPGGQINLASVDSAGEVIVNESRLDTASFEKMGDIHISQDSLIPRVSVGQNLILANLDVSANAGGKVFIRGGQMILENAKIESHTVNSDGGGIDIGLKGDLNINGIPEISGIESTPQSGISAHTLGEGKAGNIVLDVDGLVKLTHDAEINSISLSSGNGGDLVINANTVLLAGNASKATPMLVTEARKTGDAGDIVITATDKLELSDSAFVASATNNSTGGNSGTITINANSLKLSKATIFTGTSGSGRGGNINIDAKNTISLSGPNGGIISQTSGTGDSGDLTIRSDQLDIRNGTEIKTFSVSSGKIGDLSVNSNEIVLTNDKVLIRETPNGTKGIVPTGISAQVAGVSENNPEFGNGAVTVKANNLTVSNGANIVNRNFGQRNAGDLLVDANKILLTSSPDFKQYGGGVQANASVDSTGNSGNLTVNAADLVVENGTAISTSNFGAGNSGNLEVNAKNILLSRNRNQGFTLTGILNINHATGKLGTLTINTEHLQIQNGATISAETNGKGNGGLLNIRGLLNTNSQSILLSGEGSDISTQALSNSGNAGDIAILTDHLEIYDGANINTGTSGSGIGGNLTVESGAIILSGMSTGLKSISNVTSTNKAGNITISTKQLEINNQASIDTSTFGSGMGGDITVGSDLITLSGKNTGLNSISGLTSTNKAGNITISTSRLEMEKEALINTSTSGLGAGGDITVNAPVIRLSGRGTKIISASGKSSFRNAGNISIVSSDLRLENGANIAAITESQGLEGFNARIKELEQTQPKDFEILKPFIERLPVDQFASNIGNGGDITLDLGHLEVRNDSAITASTFSDGDGGNLTVKTASSIILEGSGSGSDTKILTGLATQAEKGTGNAGNLNIEHTDSLVIRNDARISASTTTSGNAGKVTINADSLLLNNALIQSESQKRNLTKENEAMSGTVDITVNKRLQLDNASLITVKTEQANAGNINVDGKGVLILSRNSTIETSVADGEGEGGNITINSPILALDTSSILANAVQGNGGNITVSGLVFESPGSIIDASSQLNMGGLVNLKPDTTISGSISVLPSTMKSVADQLSKHCAARSENGSSFVTKGRGYRPVAPGNLMPSNLLDYTPFEREKPKNDLAIEASVSNQPITKNGAVSRSDNRFQHVAVKTDCGNNTHL